MARDPSSPSELAQVESWLRKLQLRHSLIAKKRLYLSKLLSPVVSCCFFVIADGAYSSRQDSESIFHQESRSTIRGLYPFSLSLSLSASLFPSFPVPPLPLFFSHSLSFSLSYLYWHTPAHHNVLLSLVDLLTQFYCSNTCMNVLEMWCPAAGLYLHFDIWKSFQSRSLPMSTPLLLSTASLSFRCVPTKLPKK